MLNRRFLHYGFAFGEMTTCGGVEEKRFAHARKYPTHHDKTVMNGAPRSGGGANEVPRDDGEFISWLVNMILVFT